MTGLIEAVRSLELEGESSSSGRWVKLQGEYCTVYVVEAPWESGYYTWCDGKNRSVEFYRDPVEAIQAGFRRAASSAEEPLANVPS